MGKNVFIDFLNQNELSLIFFLTLQTLDIVTGFVKAVINTEVESRKMKTGLFNKTGEWVVLFVSFMLNPVFGIDIFKGVLIYYVIMEAISVIENAQSGGLSIPPVLSKFLAIKKEEVNSDDNTKSQ